MLPTARVVQRLYPDARILEGEVWTSTDIEHHFWNARGPGNAEWIDLSGQQFPPGSVVCSFEVLATSPSQDSTATQERCRLLLERAIANLRIQAVAMR